MNFNDMDDDFLLMANTKNIKKEFDMSTIHDDKEKTPKQDPKKLKILIKKHSKTIVRLLKSFITKQTTDIKEIDKMLTNIFFCIEKQTEKTK